MVKLKEQRVDILKSFCEDSYIYYYDPNSLWRLSCNFSDVYKSLDTISERYLIEQGLEAQRSLMRIKMKYQWLFIEMI